MKVNGVNSDFMLTLNEKTPIKNETNAIKFPTTIQTLFISPGISMRLEAWNQSQAKHPHNRFRLQQDPPQSLIQKI